jgi:hypothetical protein
MLSCRGGIYRTGGISVITTELLIKRTLRIPLAAMDTTADESGEGDQEATGLQMTRRWDAALMTVGFKLSTDCLRYFATRPAHEVKALAVRTLAAVRDLVGNHVQHNAYFIDFPANVPDTMEFWVSLLRRALVSANAHLSSSASPFWDDELRGMMWEGPVNLLRLPTYGTYQHSFDELVAAHDEFIPSLKDRLTILHLGGLPIEEMILLFEQLAGTATPPSTEDRALLKELAQQVLVGYHHEIFFELPGRETKAVINAAILGWQGGKDVNYPNLQLVQVNTITDVLRAVDVLSGGDGTLERPPAPKPRAEPVVRSFRDIQQRAGKTDEAPVAVPSTESAPRPATKLVSFRRGQRRLIMRTLQELLVFDPDKAAEVYRNQEAWKRLGEGLHPHEFPWCPDAQNLFAIARGEVHYRSPLAGFEYAISNGAPHHAAWILASSAPGEMARNLDRLLRHQHADAGTVLRYFEQVVSKVSSRTLLSLLAHLVNRTTADLPRVFVNRSARVYVRPDTRNPLAPEIIDWAINIVTKALTPRLAENLVKGPSGIDTVIDGATKQVIKPMIILAPEMAGVALPLSNKGVPAGLHVMPRGSMVDLDSDLDVLRFFCYWRQRSRSTDFDLSLQLLDKDLGHAGHVSWTSYHDTPNGGMTYSGDLTDATNGATEFIDVPLSRVGANVHYLVPSVYIYGGEDFGVTGQEPDAVEESIFGYMSLASHQQGMPFEPRAVRTKTEMRGRGRVATPMVFERCQGGWQAKHVHTYRAAQPRLNTVEGTASVSSLITRGLIQRRYLTVEWAAEALLADGFEVISCPDDPADLVVDRPAVYLGVTRPDGLPEHVRVITLENLTDLLPQ